jgi:recombination protein RecA
MKSLIKEYGAEAFITGDELQKYTHSVVKVSPKLDIVLGGGIPGGSVVTLAGKQKCGKSVSALHILGKAQQAGRPTYYLNVEGRLKPRDIEGIKCLDIKKLNIVRSYRKDKEVRILQAHEFLEIAEQLAHENPGAVIVIDSISQLVTEGELTSDINKQDRAPGAILMSKFCKRLSNLLAVNDIILIGILHVVANTSGYGKTTHVSGGNKIQFAMDIGLECKKFTIIREGGAEDGKPIGQDVEWITTSTAFAPPGQKTTSHITYGLGIDELAEMVDIGLELGFIEQSASWLKMPYMADYIKEDFNIKDYTIQGRANLVERLRQNPHEQECLRSSYHSLMGLAE